ncbi:AraC family transcriptional regulator [Sedimenticola hydrogenitrophicus]|uniref:AraC family transcriptional regulator n=1 Tax=Sedimenticola hydrogenitrophicus TaxID=2967975 RepID=UPI0023AE8B93|nr:AraC family transcriptional regulator [Sedimenticola hydrogenitrophicus]
MQLSSERAAKTVRDIDQHYWRNAHMPHLEIRSTYESSQGYKAHSHSELSIGVIVSGQTRLTCHGKDFVVREGDLVLIDPGRVHSCNPIEGNPRSYHMIYVDADWCLRRLSALYKVGINNYVCDGPIITDPKIYAAYLSMIDTLRHKDLSTAAPALDNLLLTTISRYCVPCENNDEALEVAQYTKQCLLKNLAEPPRLGDLERELGSSKETVIRLFKRSFGITPKAFVANARIEKSKLLLKSGMNVVDVSAEVGFSDQSQFHRTFVKYTASTPRQYQKAISIFDNKF